LKLESVWQNLTGALKKCKLPKEIFDILGTFLKNKSLQVNAKRPLLGKKLNEKKNNSNKIN